MQWTSEPGFENFQRKFDVVIALHNSASKQIADAGFIKKLHIGTIDGQFPNEFANQDYRFLVTSNYLQPGILDPQKYEQYSESWYGIYAGNVPIKKVEPVKMFNCFMNRICPTRQSWLYQFFRKKIIDQGYVSFNMDISRGIMLKNYTTPLDVFDQYFEQYLQTFAPEHTVVRPLVPYCNFNHTDELQDLILKSKYSIVVETYFERNEIITFSEKIFRCLKLPRPWMMLCMKHGVKYLRDIGFDVLDDVVDHSYDNIDHDIARQVSILDKMESLGNLEYTNALVERLESAALHNQKLLSYYLERFDSDMIETYRRVVEKNTHV